MTVLKQSLKFGPFSAFVFLLITMVAGIFYVVPNQYDYLITISIAVLLAVALSSVVVVTLVLNLVLPDDTDY